MLLKWLNYFPMDFFLPVWSCYIPTVIFFFFNGAYWLPPPQKVGLENVNLTGRCLGLLVAPRQTLILWPLWKSPMNSKRKLWFFWVQGMSSIVAFHPQNVVLAVKSCHNLWFGWICSYRSTCTWRLYNCFCNHNRPSYFNVKHTSRCKSLRETDF